MLYKLVKLIQKGEFVNMAEKDNMEVERHQAAQVGNCGHSRP